VGAWSEAYISINLLGLDALRDPSKPAAWDQASSAQLFHRVMTMLQNSNNPENKCISVSKSVRNCSSIGNIALRLNVFSTSLGGSNEELGFDRSCGLRTIRSQSRFGTGAKRA
jgi:hypothetical protein